LIYSASCRCSHHIAISADAWPDKVRQPDVAAPSVDHSTATLPCKADRVVHRSVAVSRRMTTGQRSIAIFVPFYCLKGSNAVAVLCLAS